MDKERENIDRWWKGICCNVANKSNDNYVFFSYRLALVMMTPSWSRFLPQLRVGRVKSSGSNGIWVSEREKSLFIAIDSFWYVFLAFLFISLSMHILFPCQNFLNLSAVQQNTVKYLFKQGLLRLVPSLSALNMGILHLQKASIPMVILCSLKDDEKTWLKL